MLVLNVNTPNFKGILFSDQVTTGLKTWSISENVALFFPKECR